MSENKFQRLFRAPQLTRARIIIAITIALVADGLQILCAPLIIVPAIIDLITLMLIVPTIGFHILLLPTFVVELIPLADELPTWTGCVLAVILLRKREQWISEPDVNINDANLKQVEDKPPRQ